MNRRMIIHTVGRIAQAEAAMLVLPALVSLCYLEACGWGFLITIAICLALGTAMTALSRPRSDLIYAREGFVTVALCWLILSAVHLAVSLLGALWIMGRLSRQVYPQSFKQGDLEFEEAAV